MWYGLWHAVTQRGFVVPSHSRPDHHGRGVSLSAGGAVERRCDACGALPKYRYQRGHHELRLCGHHAQALGWRLREKGWFTYRLEELATT